MSWKTPKVAEVSVGMEINMYACAWRAPKVAEVAVGADRNRSLRALQFGPLSPRCLANRTTAIPLRNAAAGGGSQNDDAKHDSSPGNPSISEVAARPARRPRIGNVVTRCGPPPSKCFSYCSRLFAGRASIHVDFHANRHFDDLWRLPGHYGLLLERDDFRPLL